MRTADHTAPDGAFATSTQLEDHPAAGYREISCDGGALLLRLNRSALSRLDLLVREGLKGSSPAHRVEVGGILIGEVAPDRSVVTLLDVVPIESEHRFDPSYRPSETDLGTFADAVAKHSGHPRSVIGYFRSHLHPTVSSRVEDENLIRRFFAQSGCSIILVHAGPADKNTAWFCHWDGGDNVRLLHQFRLDATAVPAEADHPRLTFEPALAPRSEMEVAPAATQLERQPEGGVIQPPAERKSVMAPARSDAARIGFRKTLIATAGVIALLAIFALGRFSAPPQSAPASDPGLLDLTVEVHDLIAEVKWNPASPVVRDSERGALDIVDGAGVHRIDLNQTQLLAGHYAYFPNQPDFTCLITVYRNNNAFIGATQYVHLNLPQNVTAASLTERPVDRRPLTPGLPVGKSSLEQGTDETLRIKSSRVDPDQGPGDAATLPPPRGTSFTTPPVAARTAPAPRLEDPPELRTPVTSPAASPLLVPRLADVSPPVIPSSAPPATPVAPPVTASPPPVTFSDAVPIARVRPTLPQDSRLAIRRDVSIRVAVMIDRQGRVTGASALDTNDLIERLLAPYAVQAARLWRFNPARRDGVPVASETVVAFQFEKNL